ncbi:serine/threonine protein kinase [Kocuria sp.]|uniref:protein kinase domain-containing protein n=1 Tax=Kocuria sp. TaxID=1871328 RepID=UPI0026DA9EC5|nr:serine/threonine protein kinase [Kocuria sp.]MDO4919795.1 protein kinase [Kocuria sp.]
MRDTIAGRFELLTPIAEGGSGAVWRAHDLRLGHECAAKVLRQRDSADLLRFVREQSVNLDHPHVVAPYGWAAEDEHVAIAMELVSGGTLEAALQDNGAVADTLAEELLWQLLEALHFVHTRGWVHRDVKPANILMEPTGAARPATRLTDFGIAVRLEDARLTHTGTVVGTPGYLPHEAYAPGNPSRALDLYAAGVTAVRMVLPEVDLSGDPLGPEAVAQLELFADSEVLRTGVAGLLHPDPRARAAAADRLLAELRRGAPARAEVPGCTADGEPFEIFDVLEPTTERELSPVPDAARLPPGGEPTRDAPIAWHAVHRRAIPPVEHPAMTERGSDVLRPFAPAADAVPASTQGARSGTVPTRDTSQPVPAAAGEATERLDPSAPPPPVGSHDTGPTAVTAIPSAVTEGVDRGVPDRRDPATRALPATEPGDGAGTGGERRRRPPRWWWLAVLGAAVLVLGAGYVWLAPLLVQWGDGSAPVPADPAVTTPAPGTDTGEPSPVDPAATPVCTQLEDGTVSCVVAP